jgi:tRNA-dihydrouridine synthase
LKSNDYRFSVAPMMDWTDRHCRVFHRLLTRRARLYTEMLTTGAILHGDRARLLSFDASENPLALQLGGSVPRDLAAAARWIPRPFKSSKRPLTAQPRSKSAEISPTLRRQALLAARL